MPSPRNLKLLFTSPLIGLRHYIKLYHGQIPVSCLFSLPEYFFLLLSSSHRVGPNPARIKAAQSCVFLPNSWETKFLSRTTERTAPRTAPRCSPVASSLSPCSSPSASWPQWSTRWVRGQGMVRVVVVYIVVTIPKQISRSIPAISARKSL